MGTNWVFVDDRVDDREALLTGLRADSEWRLVGPDEDGLRQIRAALDGQRDLASIRIVAHGRSGAILLGSTEIDGDTLAGRDGELAQIGQALAAGGDLQLYGCAVGDGEVGRAFVDALAEGLGVPVAASSTPVGHADLGGDWWLDVGELRTKPLNVPEWRGLLTTIIIPVFIGGGGGGGGTLAPALVEMTAVGSAIAAGNGKTGFRSQWKGGDLGAIATAVDLTVLSWNLGSSAALRPDGTVATWDYLLHIEHGGDSSAVADRLIDVRQIFGTYSAFAALRGDGSVVTWGEASGGGDSGDVASQIDGTVDVVEVWSTSDTFAALRADGSLVTWGDSVRGGGGPGEQLDPNDKVTRVYANDDAFAALLEDGSVIAWGNPFVIIHSPTRLPGWRGSWGAASLCERRR